MPRRKANNVIDLRTGKPLELPPEPVPAKKRRKTKNADTSEQHTWEFKPRFRKGAFGWQSASAIRRITEAVMEIQKVASADSELAGEGAVILLEKLAPALEHVDGSSGAIGAAVNHAIEQLTAVIEVANVDHAKRLEWLDRLWKAIENDHRPFIEHLGACWGNVCATPEIASKWADANIDETRRDLRGESDDLSGRATCPCLSALLKAKRYDELFGLLALDERKMWFYQEFGVKALAEMGKATEAVAFAEGASKGYAEDWIASICEDILLKAGRVDEAYEKYAVQANGQNSYLATFRAIAKKYPKVEHTRVLEDLIRSTPGQEHKWFATAKELKLYDLAAELARKGPCDPKPLTRAAHDHMQANPEFALQVGMAALDWLVQGHGYKIVDIDVSMALMQTMKAARLLGREGAVRQAVMEQISKAHPRSMVAKVLTSELARI